MTTLTDLFSEADLDSVIDAGLVRFQTHPVLPYRIFNYTEKCAYDNAWNPVTLACRGLIADEAGIVLARPFAKFFNHGQPGAPVIGLDEPVTVTDKADGSLGVIFPTPDGPAVATRGSFDSAQARHATALLRERYPDWAPPDGHTVLVEIIYPGNRIVLDYAGLDDLVLLGTVEIATGRSTGPEGLPGWPGPAVETFAYPTFGEALAAPARPYREGLVVQVLADGSRVKLKYEDYLDLHRIAFGLSAKGVWEAVVAGLDTDAIAAPLPDEFHGWVRDTVARLQAEVAVLSGEVEAAYDKVVSSLPEGWSRKDFAQAVAGDPLRGYLFVRLDERSYLPSLWQRVRPSADERPYGWLVDEDTGKA